MVAETRGARSRAQHLGPERRRPQVLDAALAIAVQDGIGAVNVGSVAAHLGVTRPVVYACFSDRVEMVEALLDREGGALLDSMLDALHSTGGSPGPQEAFVQGFRSMLAAVAANPDPWRLMFTGAPDPAVSARFRQAREHLKQRSTEWFRPAVLAWWQTPDLDRKLPVLIELFLCSCEAAVRSFLAGVDGWTADELGEFMGLATCRAFEDA